MESKLQQETRVPIETLVNLARSRMVGLFTTRDEWESYKEGDPSYGADLKDLYKMYFAIWPPENFKGWHPGLPKPLLDARKDQFNFNHQGEGLYLFRYGIDTKKAKEAQTLKRFSNPSCLYGYVETTSMLVGEKEDMDVLMNHFKVNPSEVKVFFDKLIMRPGVVRSMERNGTGIHIYDLQGSPKEVHLK